MQKSSLRHLFLTKLNLLPGALLLSVLPLQAQVTLTTLTVSDDSPDSGGSIAHLFLGPPSVDGAGRVAFHSTYFAGAATPTSRSGIFTGLSGAPQLLVSGPSSLLPGDPAPGGGTFNGLFGYPMVNAGGRVVFSAATSEGKSGLWTSSAAGSQLVALSGAPAPGTTALYAHNPGTSPFDLSAINDAGQVAFGALLTGGSATNNGIWAGAPGAVQLAARLGSQVPGFPTGVNFASFRSAPALNEASKIAFAGETTLRTPNNSDGYGGLWAGTPGSLQLIARSGTQAPEAEPGTRLFFFRHGQPALNNADEIAFMAGLYPDDSLVNPDGISDAIYLKTSAGLRLVARTKFPAPGVPGRNLYALQPPLLNAAGEVAFLGQVETPNADDQYGVWLGRPGQLRLIARAGAIAPGTANAEFRQFSKAVLSDSGQIAFYAEVWHGDTVTANRIALFATDKTGVLRLVARLGDSLNGSPPVAGIGSDQFLLSMSPRGDLVFDALWTNAGNGYHGREAYFLANFPASAPVIVQEWQPVNQQGVQGGSATFQVTAGGNRPATFQWRFNGADIAGASGPALTLANLSAADRGAYTVVITNALGTIESQPAALTFPPEITIQPRDQSAAAGTTVTLAVAATGRGTLTYQWQFQPAGAVAPADISGAVSPVLMFNAVTAAHAGRYRVRVINPDGQTDSVRAMLTVAPAGHAVIERLAPGGERALPAGSAFFQGLPLGVLNNHGGILFQTGLAGAAGQGLGSAILGGEPGAYQRYLNGIAHPNLSDSIRAAFQGDSLTVMTGTPWDLYTITGGNPTRGPVINDTGVIAFRRDGGIWAGKSGVLQLVAKTGNPAPDAGAGANFSVVGEPVLNVQGQLAFWGSVTGPEITAANNEGIWFGPAAAPRRVALESAPAPGVAAGAVFAGFPTFEPSFNAAGQIVFHAALSGTGITAANNEGIWAGAPDALALVVQRGASSGGQTFTGLKAFTLPPPRINAAGQVLFYADCSAPGGSRQTIWLWTPGAGPGTLRMIVREGDQAPGMPAGVVFDSAANGQPYFFGCINAAGQIAFSSFLSGPGVDASLLNDMGLWMTDPAGEVKPIVRTGDSFDTGGGEMKTVTYTVSAILGSGGEDGLQRALSDRGEFIFSASFGLGAANTGGLFRAHFPSLISALSYTDWIAAYPGLTAAERHPDADPDHDGRSNFHEYAHHSDPVAPSGEPWNPGIVRIDGQDWLIEQYRRYDDRIAAGVSYVPEGGSALGGWHTAGIIDEPDPDAPVISGSTGYRCRVPTGSIIKFLRVKAVKW